MSLKDFTTKCIVGEDALSKHLKTGENSFKASAMVFIKSLLDGMSILSGIVDLIWSYDLKKALKKSESPHQGLVGESLGSLAGKVLSLSLDLLRYALTESILE